MHPIAILDFASFIICVIALVIIMTKGRIVTLPRTVTVALSTVLLLSALHYLGLGLEWSGIVSRFSLIKDISGLLLPLVWAAVFYYLTKQSVNHEPGSDEKSRY
jgi:hypothetical protein